MPTATSRSDSQACTEKNFSISLVPPGRSGCRSSINKAVRLDAEGQRLEYSVKGSSSSIQELGLTHANALSYFRQAGTGSSVSLHRLGILLSKCWCAFLRNRGLQRSGQLV